MKEGTCWRRRHVGAGDTSSQGTHARRRHEHRGDTVAARVPGLPGKRKLGCPHGLSIVKTRRSELPLPQLTLSSRFSLASSASPSPRPGPPGSCGKLRSGAAAALRCLPRPRLLSAYARKGERHDIIGTPGHLNAKGEHFLRPRFRLTPLNCIASPDEAKSAAQTSARFERLKSESADVPCLETLALRCAMSTLALWGNGSAQNIYARLSRQTAAALCAVCPKNGGCPNLHGKASTCLSAAHTGLL